MYNGESKLYYLTLHEIGHILGIGAFWNNNIIKHNLPVNYDDSSNKYYIGMNGLREYRSYFNNSELLGIPIENDGGSSTANVHLEENERYINGIYHPGLDHELMTGWTEAYSTTPMSRISIALLEDIGFSVNYDESDYYDPDNTFATG